MAHSQKSIRDRARNRTHPNVPDVLPLVIEDLYSRRWRIEESFLLLKRLLGLSYL